MTRLPRDESTVLPRKDDGDERKPMPPAADRRGFFHVLWNHPFWNHRIHSWQAVCFIVAYAVFISAFTSWALRPPKPPAKPLPPPLLEMPVAKDQAKADRESVRVIPIYRPPEPVPAPAPEPPPKPLVEKTAPPAPPAAEPEPEPNRRLTRHWHEPDGERDVCARHNMRKVTRGKGWRCVRIR